MKFPKDFINKVIHGDCLKVMKQMPNESVDMIIADPPFNKNLNYGKYYNDARDPVKYWRWLDKRIKEMFRILKKDTRFYIFHCDDGIFDLKPICEKYHFKYHQTLIWFRPNMTTSNRIKGDWHFMHENILLFHKGKRTKMLPAHEITNCFSVRIYPSPQSNFKGGRDHPAQKPVKLMASLIARTPGEIILDPFCGVGSSLRAAKNIKRQFIGIEINPDYCKIAEEILAQEVI